MVNFATSYFYQIRFFKRNMLPVSTAMSDPFYYYGRFRGDVWRDKRGIWNGINAQMLHQPIDKMSDCACEHCVNKDPNQCSMYADLRKFYDSLSFDEVIQRATRIGNHLKDVEHLRSDIWVVFMFYESPRNPCSERYEFQQWFKRNGYDLQELKYPIVDNYLDV